MSTPSTTRMSIRAPRLALVAGLAAIIAVPAAHGQNALGDGSRLESSLRVGSGGYNGVSAAGRTLDNNLRAGSGGWNGFGRNFGAESAYRNAIVTGNVGGGREFRGSVGYTAADDFRGFLGSNTNFQFERDSFYSGLATRNLRGLESIRNPLAYTVAGQRDTAFGGGLIINRAGVGASGATIENSQGPSVTHTDVFGNIAGTLRSPSVQTSRNDRMPEVVAYTNTPDANGVVRVMSASPLIGIRSIRSDSPMFNPVEAGLESSQPDYINRPLPSGLPIDDKAKTDEAESDRVISPYQVVMESLRGTPSNVAIKSAPVGMSTTEPDSNVLKRPTLVPETGRTDGADGAVEDEESPTGLGSNLIKLPKFDENLERLRMLLQGGQVRPRLDDTGDGSSDENGGAGEEADTQDEELATTAPELAAQILSGKTALVIELADPPTPGNIFAEHMRRGAALLKDERWFDAEERFTAALSVRPGDPIAAAARLTAQLGGGMFRSASINMRNLLGAYPEMMVTRFDRSLIGTEARTGRVKAQLRQRMELSTPTARECALLLAYVGYQTEDPQAIREAFDRLDEIVADLQSETDPLERTLRAVWLDSPPTHDPAPAP